MKQAFLCTESVSHRDEVHCLRVIHSIHSLSLAPMNLVIAIIVAAFTSLIEHAAEEPEAKNCGANSRSIKIRAAPIPGDAVLGHKV